MGVVLAGTFEMGITGILLATTISTQLALLVVPSNVYKYIFKRSSKTYLKKTNLFNMHYFSY